MVTLAGTQNLNEFELHLRPWLGCRFRPSRSSVWAPRPSSSRRSPAPRRPRYEGIDRALAADPRTDVRIFGKPSARVNRRMGVVTGYAPLDGDLEALRERVKAAAAEIKVLEP